MCTILLEMGVMCVECEGWVICVTCDTEGLRDGGCVYHSGGDVCVTMESERYRGYVCVGFLYVCVPQTGRDGVVYVCVP
jgi:hypothetical protein